MTGTGGNLMVDKDNGNPFALYNGATITIDEGAKARLMATKYGGTGNDWDRDVEFLGVLAGKGDFEIANCVAGKSFTVRLTNGSPAFEGTVSVAPADAEAPTDGSLQVYPSTLIYAPAADAAMDWSKACLVFTDAVSLNPAGGTHLIVGELSLAQNMTFRLNAENGDAIDVVGAGFTGAGALSIALPEDFDPASQTFYPLGKIAKGAALPKVSGGNWKVTTQPIADDEDNLVYGIRSASGFVILIQ